MTRKVTLVLATAASVVMTTEAALACSGNACNVLAMKYRGYNHSENWLQFDMTNNDKTRAIRVKGCILTRKSGRSECGHPFETKIDPGKTAQMGGPAGNDPNLPVNITDASFIDQKSGSH